MKNIIIAPLAIVLLMAGCAKKPGASMQSNGFVTSAGLANAADIRMVIYQPAGFGHLPMPPQMPLRSKPMQITAQTDIAAIFDAVNLLDGKAETREARNNRLALIGRGGQVVMLGITTPTIYGCDMAREQSSKKLGSALSAAIARAKTGKLALASPTKSLSYHDAGGTTRSSSAKNQALQELKDSEWPPKLYDTNARLERVRFDTITIFSEGNGLSRFVFTDTQNGECLFTDPVRSLRLVKEAHGRTPPVYGPDLFEEVVSALSKP